jgi:hypothetical protein
MTLPLINKNSALQSLEATITLQEQELKKINLLSHSSIQKIEETNETVKKLIRTITTVSFFILFSAAMIMPLSLPIPLAIILSAYATGMFSLFLSINDSDETITPKSIHLNIIQEKETHLSQLKNLLIFFQAIKEEELPEDWEEHEFTHLKGIIQRSREEKGGRDEILTRFLKEV